MRLRFRPGSRALALASVLMGCGCLHAAIARSVSAPPVVPATTVLVAPPPMPVQPGLPETTIQALCDRFDGQPSFDDSKGRNRIDCDVVHRMVARRGVSVIGRMQRVLSEAQTLAGLQTASLPAGLSCGRFDEFSLGEERVVHCSTAMGNQAMHVDFIGNRGGHLLRVEMDVRYRSIMVDAWDDEVRRGAVQRYFPAWVDLLVAIDLADCRYHAGNGDTVEFDGDVLRMVVLKNGQR